MTRSPVPRRASTLLRTLPAGACFLWAGSLQAHPGHDLFEQGPVHAFTSPFHLTLLATVGLAMFLGAHLVRRRLPRRVLQSVGLIALAVSLAVALSGWSFQI